MCVQQSVHFSNEVLNVCLCYCQVVLQSVVFCKKIVMLAFQLSKFAIICTVINSNFCNNWYLLFYFILFKLQSLLSLFEFCSQCFKLISKFLLHVATLHEDDLLSFKFFHLFLMLFLLRFKLFISLSFQFQKSILGKGLGLPPLK